MSSPKKILDKEKIKNYLSAGYPLKSIFNNLCLQFDDMESFQIFKDFESGATENQIIKKFFDI
jgi:hypothetical protein